MPCVPVALWSIPIQNAHAARRPVASDLTQLDRVDLQLAQDAGHGQEGLEWGDAFEARVAELNVRGIDPGLVPR